MFTSKEFLHLHLGVDPEIAKFFVDRKIPADNLYWKGKYLYVASGTGFLFIPLFIDLQCKLGVNKYDLLEETYVQLIEAILHSAALYEHQVISFEDHLANCRKLLENRIYNQQLYQDLNVYLTTNDLKPYKNLGTTNRALNRADTFLFSLCALKLPRTVVDPIIFHWYTLVPCLLLLDDITDLKDDLHKNEENAVTEFGPGSLGIIRAIEFLKMKFAELRTINSLVADYLEGYLEIGKSSSYMKSLLND
ncbi:MAG TPA: hypothetical protein VEZ17_11060 [Chitinophagaceae bacterium]|nr:hypothetical protein [Chitinophagaceae bacterium]